MNKIDIKVLSFINGKSTLSFFELVDFLKGESLPLRIQWIYYLRGMHYPFDSSDFEPDYDNEGPQEEIRYVDYWEIYLSDSEIRKIEIERFLREAGSDCGKFYVHQEFIRQGWEYVEQRFEDEAESQNDYIGNEYFKKQQHFEWSRGPLSNDNYCEACQSDPCMCSDPIN